MGFSDDQIHDILELKEQLTEEIEKHLEEIEKLEKNISILNTILKQTSFTKASDLTLNTEKKKDAVPIIKNVINPRTKPTATMGNSLLDRSDDIGLFSPFTCVMRFCFISCSFELELHCTQSEPLDDSKLPHLPQKCWPEVIFSSL